MLIHNLFLLHSKSNFFSIRDPVLQETTGFCTELVNLFTVLSFISPSHNISVELYLFLGGHFLPSPIIARANFTVYVHQDIIIWYPAWTKNCNNISTSARSMAKYSRKSKGNVNIPDKSEGCPEGRSPKGHPELLEGILPLFLRVLRAYLLHFSELRSLYSHYWSL